MFLYKQETGGIISPNKNILHLVDGTAGSVEFPAELIIQLHKESKGIVYCLAHVHPPSMTEMSGLDEEMLRGWTIALFPFNVRLSVISQTEGWTFNSLEVPFRETVYFGNLESREAWEARGKQGTRKLEIIKEQERIYWYKLPIKDSFKDRDYIATLVERSYQDG